MTGGVTVVNGEVFCESNAQAYEDQYAASGRLLYIGGTGATVAEKLSPGMMVILPV